MPPHHSEKCITSYTKPRHTSVGLFFKLSFDIICYADLVTCNTENQYITSISSIVRKALGSCSTVIARIVSGHKSVSVILWKFK